MIEDIPSVPTNIRTIYQTCKTMKYENTRSNSYCSFSVYRYLLSKMKVQTVHCDTRVDNLKMMSAQLGSIEKLTSDVDEFIKNETVWQRIARYSVRDPNTGEYPGNYMKFIHTGIAILGIHGILGFGVSVKIDNRQFKKLNPYSYKDRRFQKERVLALMYNGTKVGMKVAWTITRLFGPFIVISLGLTIIQNSTNPVNFALGFGASSALNHNLFGRSPGIMRVFLFGCAAGFGMGGVLYYVLHRNGHNQEMINRVAVSKKLFYESPAKYS